MFIDKRHKMFILPLSYSIYSSIQEGIAFFTPHVKDFLNNGKISNLEFLTQHIENLFIQGRSFSESQLIIAWLITSENPRYLIKLFVGAIIADVATKDEIIEEKRLDIQHELINSEISKANLRLLIFNVDNLKVFIELQHKVRFQ